MIIDIHSHIRLNPHDQAAEEQALMADMERNGIGLRVVSALDGWDEDEGNRYVSELVQRHPDVLVGCAVVNPKRKDAAEVAARALALPGIGMLELNSLEHGYYPDSCPGVEEVLAVAERAGVPVKVFSGIGSRAMPQQWMGHVRQHPGLPFVFLHMGCFDYGYGCIDLALEVDNLYLETSNQYELQILRKAVSVAPASRLVFGSMWPERLTKCSLDVFDTIDVPEEFHRLTFEENAVPLIERARAAMFGEEVAR